MEHSLSFIVIILSSCIVCSIAGEGSSPPYILKQSPKVVLFSGSWYRSPKEPFYIECEATGQPAPRYFWTKNGKPLTVAESTRISFVNSTGTLAISLASDADEGIYQCFAENSYGIATSSPISAHKLEIYTYYGDTIRIISPELGKPLELPFCEVPYPMFKPRIYWIYNNRYDYKSKDINDSRITADPRGHLWFSNITESDSRWGNIYYHCVIEFGNVRSYIGANVLLETVTSNASTIEIRQQPILQYVTEENKTAYRGESLELFCIFGGTPLPETMWLKNGRLVQLSSRVTLRNYGKTLDISDVGFEDAGIYTCEVTNGVGQNQSHSINVTVQAAPYFTREPEIVKAIANQTITFHCQADGAPKPNINWIYNGKSLAQAPLNTRRKVFRDRIIIENVEARDTGNYGCNATNSLGYIYKDVYLNVIETSGKKELP